MSLTEAERDDARALCQRLTEAFRRETVYSGDSVCPTCGANGHDTARLVALLSRCVGAAQAIGPPNATPELTRQCVTRLCYVCGKPVETCGTGNFIVTQAHRECVKPEPQP